MVFVRVMEGVGVLVPSVGMVGGVLGGFAFGSEKEELEVDGRWMALRKRSFSGMFAGFELGSVSSIVPSRFEVRVGFVVVCLPKVLFARRRSLF